MIAQIAQEEIVSRWGLGRSRNRSVPAKKTSEGLARVIDFVGALKSKQNPLCHVTNLNYNAVYDADIFLQAFELEEEVGTLSEDLNDDKLYALIEETARYFSGTLGNKSLVDFRTESQEANLQIRADLMNAGFEYFTEAHDWKEVRELVQLYESSDCAMIVTDHYDQETGKAQPGRVDLFYKIQEIEN
ncbi:MAG: hypothetical protein ABIG93_02830 [archaeon]|nr:hypothetical protein [Nanoarchaeota archaeon]